MPSSRFSALTFVVALCAQHNAQAAETVPIAVTWTAPAGCPSLADVQASIQRLLGSSPGPRANSDIAVQASASLQHDGRWLGVVETKRVSNNGKRSLVAESCQAVAGATALIVALMIDPDAVAAHQAADAPASQPARPTVPQEQPPPAPARPAPKAPSPRKNIKTPDPTRPRDIKVFFGPLVAANAGTLPSVAAGAGVDVGVLSPIGSIDMGAWAWTSSSATVDGQKPGAGGEFRLLSAFFAACPTRSVGRFTLGACADLHLNRVKGNGVGAVSNYENAFTWLSAGAGALLRVRLGPRVSVPLRLGVLLPLAHPTFVINRGSGAPIEVYGPSRVAVTASLGLHWIL